MNDSKPSIGDFVVLFKSPVVDDMCHHRINFLISADEEFLYITKHRAPKYIGSFAKDIDVRVKYNYLRYLIH